MKHTASGVIGQGRNNILYVIKIKIKKEG